MEAIEAGLVSMTAGFSELSKADQVKAVVRTLARVAPELEDLPPEALAKLAQIVTTENLRDDMRRRVKLEKLDYPSERQKFLTSRGSPHTVKAYQRALGRLDDWCARQGVSVLELDPAKADDWIEAEKATGRSAPSVRLSVSAVSAFWSWMERRHPRDLARNPFRGTRARPKDEHVKKVEVPGQDEIKVMMKAAQPWLRAAIACMAGMGLRVGALPSLSIRGARWTADTKGKEQKGTVPESVRKEITLAGLPLNAPFEGRTAQRIADTFAYLIGKLEKAGQLRARYSVHDLRHAFAVKLYESSGHDIYRVRNALGHADISTTETYLRSLDVEGV